MKFKNILIVFLLLSGLLFGEESYDDYWPNWRGPNNDGVSIKGTPPTEWSETNNIKWKTPIPGDGLGTPVIWGDQIFITTAIELDKIATEKAIKEQNKSDSEIDSLLEMSQSTDGFLQFVVYSINRKNGEIRWKKVVREQFPLDGIIYYSSYAAASCVTDGKHIIASFGSYGIYCFDMTGEMLWEKDLGDMPDPLSLGEGTSPVIYKNNLVVTWDNVGQSKIYVLNKNTGEEIWQKDRNEDYTWATPIVIEYKDKPQIIVPGKNKSISYDLDNGNIIWEVDGLKESIISCPVYDGERIFFMSGEGKLQIVQAIDLKKAKGNANAIAWSINKGGSYVPSPLLKDEKLYYLKGSRSQISCVDAKTGEFYYDSVKPEGMKGAYASPVSANGNIYILDQKGNCSVIKEGKEFKVIAKNKLDDIFDASPAIVGNELFLRGHKSIYCISE